MEKEKSVNQFRSHLKFGLLNYIRYLYFKTLLGKCGKNVYFEKNVQLFRFTKNIAIGDDVVLKEGAKVCTANSDSAISIGARTTIGYYTYIFASDKISIGSDCLIAPFVYIVDSDHNIEKEQKINEQPNNVAPVKIGEGVWIATGAKILKGVEIGNGAVVAAGAVVTQNVNDFSIVGGIPAKVIGERK